MFMPIHASKTYLPSGWYCPNARALAQIAQMSGAQAFQSGMLRTGDMQNLDNLEKLDIQNRYTHVYRAKVQSKLPVT
ncbi:hypothetical protein AK812_SmicGene15075 [Symbiodinium microadriaticum]|uniref:Uncharacterized protein n=1 Tax=Symbiodinium microadriaticum TaxID=2951 RepID=A0A1Q9E412_SYMMI|nr:hypothetical protein AK812_SmicGene15075 [Symbiodinium microadriaticum]